MNYQSLWSLTVKEHLSNRRLNTHGCQELGTSCKTFNHSDRNYPVQEEKPTVTKKIWVPKTEQKQQNAKTNSASTLQGGVTESTCKTQARKDFKHQSRKATEPCYCCAVYFQDIAKKKHKAEHVHVLGHLDGQSTASEEELRGWSQPTYKNCKGNF